MNARMWNPHYTQYARVHGRTPSRQLRRDRKAHHGAAMLRFVLWMSAQRAQFAAAHPEAMQDKSTIGDHEEWAQWLAGVPTVASMRAAMSRAAVA